MKTRKNPFYLFALILLMVSCSSDEADSSQERERPVEESRKVVNILTRTEGDEVSNSTIEAGLYMVNNVDGQAKELMASNNYVDNQLMTWGTSGWTTATPIYWSDMDTKATFYAYAPYQAGIVNAREVPCCVQSDQRIEAAFTQSDFLWGKAEGRSPQDGGFRLTMSHVLSLLTVTVTADEGFDEGELKDSDLEVTFGGSKTEGRFDLATGILTVNGSANDVRCLSAGNLSYKAVLLPQDVPFSNLIQVNWKGNLYTLQNSYKLESSRQYSLTVKLKKTTSGFDIGITGWDIIDEDFGGTIGGN